MMNAGDKYNASFVKYSTEKISVKSSINSYINCLIFFIGLSYNIQY